MNYRFNYQLTPDSINKLIEAVKYEIRQVQEDRYYQAVERITDEQRATLVQTLKKIQKDTLGPIDVCSVLISKGVPRTEYKFVVYGEAVAKLSIHGTEDGIAYLVAYEGFEQAVSMISQRFR